MAVQTGLKVNFMTESAHSALDLEFPNNDPI